MDQAIRNKLRGIVTQCRKLLEDFTAQALQGRFGIYEGRKKGEVQIEDEARMAHLAEEDRACRQDLLDHLGHIQAIGYKPSEALEQLIREIAFTHLNRLCAYKMMESRGLIREAVSRGFKSQGFFFYLADHPEAENLHKSGQQDLAYRNFLDWLGGTLSQEIGVLFNPNDPANRIYPPQRVLDEVLALINDGELKDIWTQDETIGWVYQYFTPKELRDKARKESQAPRNSYELAFRNQFFTPRYVVEFLTDNTLGRIWYEMRKDKTVLKDRCRYLVRRPTEIFLEEGEKPFAEAKDTREDLSQEELLKQPVYIPHRPKKDPRDIKVLDPACGSGHFLLYCFDLLQVIYEEAYDDPDLGTPLRKDYPALDDLRSAVPGLILKHNLHGIDIDLRATQIAVLALWLRCQRAYQDLGLKNGERPKITRSNIVCAEPMPGEMDLLKEFTATLQPKVLGQLVEAVFDKMKIAGEAGSLLKIEEEIRETAGKAKFEFIHWKKHQEKTKWSLFPELVKRDQPSIFDFIDMTDEVFLNRAEEEIVTALRQYAEKASNGKGFRRRLFVKDAAQGFSFVDVCNKRYDVVLMNPPFGDATEKGLAYLVSHYPISKKNLYIAFIERATQVCAQLGRVGSITDRTFVTHTRHEEFRDRYIYGRWDGWKICCLIDHGWGVLDSYVQTASSILSQQCNDGKVEFFDLKVTSNPGLNLLLDIQSLPSGVANERAYIQDLLSIQHLPKGVIAFWMPNEIIDSFKNYSSLDPVLIEARSGLSSSDNERFYKLVWEVPRHQIGKSKRWSFLANGGDPSPFFRCQTYVIDYEHDGMAVKQFARDLYTSETRTIKNQSYYRRFGITYGKRTENFNVQALPSDQLFSNEGHALFSSDKDTLLVTCAYLNSTIAAYILNCIAGLHKESGYVGSLPVPAGILENAAKFKRAAASGYNLMAQGFSRIPESQQFSSVLPSTCNTDFEIESALKQMQDELQSICEEVDSFVEEAFLLSPKSLNRIGRRHWDVAKILYDSSKLDQVRQTYLVDILGWVLGIMLGRWDIRFGTGVRQFPELPHPFDPLPVCPPGMFQGPDGLPAKPEDVPSDYPIRINWDGILVDDPGHEDDIIRRVRDVLEVIWKDRAEAIEQEACEILGLRELRDYFRKPGNGGFWVDHVKRYSKSRRKAPIYWYLRSAKGNYGLWLYYHRLDKDILFKALLNYVEPKIRLEEDRLKTLRGRKEAVGSSGREAKQIEKDIDRLEQFISELHDFANKLRRAANLHLDFDLNDGVILNIAPFWELVPWNEPKKYWEELQEGKYDWSHIAYQLWPGRVKELCKKDRSMAIAHGLEDIYDLETGGNHAG